MEYLTTPRRRLCLLVDAVVVFLSFPLSHVVGQWVTGRDLFAWGGTVFFQTYLLTIVSWLIALLLFSEYPVRRLTAPWREWWVALRVSIVAVLLFGTLTFIMKLHYFSRAFLATNFVVTCLALILIRVLIRLILGFFRRSGRNYRTRLVIGNGHFAQKYTTAVEEYPRLGLRILGFIAETDERLDVPYLGDFSALRETLQRQTVDGVVVALSVSDPRTEYVIQECELQGIQVELMLDSMSSRLTNSQMVYGMGLPRMVLSNIPHTTDGLAIKRVTDVVLSLLALILLSPLFAVIALAIKLTDRGSIFFVQERSGLRGRTFKMYKFRSMHVDAEKMRDTLLHMNEMSGPVFKLTNDPRVTRVGRWLRSTSLDELPQLINVLRGDMSLVGPRPPIPSEVNAYDPAYRRRLSVKPGLTCLWQISGRNEIDFDDWMRLDLRYIDNWSYWRDWEILLKTIPAVIKRRGAS